ncbi:MAG TPA: hypothetical protein DCF33_10845 [Saprospirales bacterium]|nr:hypothetical protein [Saprospirales bacterium]
MKQLVIILCVTGFLFACQNQAEPPKQEVQEVQQVERQPVDNQEFEKQKEAAEKEGVYISNSDIVGSGKANIIGKNVAIRKGASFSTESLGVFAENEPVTMISYQVVQSEGEGILNQPVTLSGKGGNITVAKGKTILIVGTNNANSNLLVAYDDPKKGRFEGEVNASVFQTRIFAVWHQVERPNGEKGWVLGKDLQPK